MKKTLKDLGIEAMNYGKELPLAQGIQFHIKDSH
jgi:hypothetical protein